MSDKERIERVERYVRDELDLSREMVGFYRERNDTKRVNHWLRRYDTLYGVLLRIID